MATGTEHIATGLEAVVITVSDGVSAGERQDGGGPAVVEALEAAGFDVVATTVVPDGVESVRDALAKAAREFNGLVVTTGGTGFGPRDMTPEGTRQAVERDAPGLAEAMRLASPLGRLSRATAGTIGSCLVVNLPGSPRGAVECLGAILDVLPHAIRLLGGTSQAH